MDTQLLQAFIAVADHRSFSLAAQQLQLTQSAVSKRITVLEQQLSTLLFDRMGRTITLTESGNILLPRAQQLINDAQETVRLLQQQTDKVEGVLRIATSHHIGVHRLPPYLQEYTRRYPDVQLELHFLDSEKTIEAIRNNTFDLAIITLPKSSRDDGSDTLQRHILWQDPMYFVVGKQHPLCTKNASQNTPIHIRELANYPAILPDKNTRTTQLIIEALAKKKVNPNIAMTTNHLDAIKMMVGVGLGWSALPERLIDDSVRRLSIDKLSLVRELGCIHQRHRTLTNAARAMLTCLKGALKER